MGGREWICGPQVTCLLEGKRIRSAVEACKGIDHIPDAGERLTGLYHLACIYWECVGDGESARRSFRAVDDCAVTIPVQEYALLADEFNELVANSRENLMLLSLSFEEYGKWAKSLGEIYPDADILRGQVPQINRLQDQGHPWSKVMQVFAGTYYNRNDRARDPGKYGAAACTYQLLLRNRQVLHLPRGEWKQAVYEYGALLMRITLDYARAADRIAMPWGSNEILFIMEDGIPLLQECVEANPSDETLQMLWRNTQGHLQELRSAGAAYDAHPAAITSSELPLPLPAAECPRCGANRQDSLSPCPGCGFTETWTASLAGAGFGVLVGAAVGAIVWAALSGAKAAFVGAIGLGLGCGQLGLLVGPAVERWWLKRRRDRK